MVDESTTTVVSVCRRVLEGFADGEGCDAGVGGEMELVVDRNEEFRLEFVFHENAVSRAGSAGERVRF